MNVFPNNKISVMTTSDFDERRKIALVDVDGVLLDWRSTFIDWMAERGHAPITDQVDDWELDNSFPTLESVGVVQYIRQFNESARIGFLPAFPDAVKYLKKLRDHGFGFIAVTAMGKDRYANELRIMNLRQAFGFSFDAITFTDLGESKKSVLQNWISSHNIRFWVEDKLSNAVDGADLGIPTYLINRHPKQICDDPRICVVKSWEGIYKSVEG